HKRCAAACRVPQWLPLRVARAPRPRQTRRRSLGCSRADSGFDHSIEDRMNVRLSCLTRARCALILTTGGAILADRLPAQAPPPSQPASQPAAAGRPFAEFSQAVQSLVAANASSAKVEKLATTTAGRDVQLLTLAVPGD